MDTSMQMSQQLWGVGIIGLILGLVIGYIIFKSSSTKGKLATKELEKMKKESAEQKAQIEEHFAESAELMGQLAKDYQKLYRHLATSSSTLAPQLVDKVFNTEKLLVEDTTVEEKSEAVEELPATEEPNMSDLDNYNQQKEGSLAEENKEEADKEVETKDEASPPKDYSNGSSGILK